MKIDFIEKYRKEAYDSFVGDYCKERTWRAVWLEAIFRPVVKVPGKTDMSHLHPDIDKLHLPPDVYIADWRKYKVEDHPALMNFQKRCHAAGLHDPWLRNFAFQFYPNHLRWRSRWAWVTQGCCFGFVMGGILFGALKVKEHYFPTIYEHSPEYVAKYGNRELHH